MGRSKFILVLTIVLVLAAGVVVGRLWAKLPVAAAPAEKSSNWVRDQLDLTPEQQKQMDAIWAETRQKISATFEQRRNLDHQRDQKIVELLSEQQKAAYDQIMSDFRQQRTDLEKERADLVKGAEERSRALLTDDQKRRWDAMPRGPHEHGGPPRPPGGMGPPGATSSPTTRPFRPMRGDHPFPGH